MESSSTSGGDPHQYLTSAVGLSVSGTNWVSLILILLFTWIGIWLLATSRSLRQTNWDEREDIRNRGFASLELAGAFTLASAAALRYYYFPLLFGPYILSFLAEVFVLMFLVVFVHRLVLLGMLRRGSVPSSMAIVAAGISSRFLGWMSSLPNTVADFINTCFGKEAISFELSEEAAAEEAPEHNQEELNLEESHIRFGDRQVKQIMKPRGDVHGVEENLEYLAMMAVVREAGYSRLPVYRENLDNIVGVLYVKDLLHHLDKDNTFRWQDLVRKPLFVPETIKIDSLLRQMKRARVHVALTVDEYGSTAGLVTMEDIMEEVMGEIRDEYDEGKEVEYEKVDESSYIFEGKTLLHDMCRVLGLENDTFDEVKGDTDTIAGLLLQLEERLPAEGEEINHDRFTFTVLQVGMNRIERVKVITHESAQVKISE